MLVVSITIVSVDLQNWEEPPDESSTSTVYVPTQRPKSPVELLELVHSQVYKLGIWS